MLVEKILNFYYLILSFNEIFPAAFRTEVTTFIGSLNVSESLKNHDILKFTLNSNIIFNIHSDKHTHSENTNKASFIYNWRGQQFGINGVNFYSRLLI